MHNEYQGSPGTETLVSPDTMMEWLDTLRKWLIMAVVDVSPNIAPYPSVLVRRYKKLAVYTQP
jgi:hypothetical protein